MKRIVRAACLGLVRLFYRRIAAAGLEHLPHDGAVVVVANHPNGLLDPVVLRLGLHRGVAFLGKSTLFVHPIGRMAMGAFAGIPVYRPRDGQDTAQNERTFDLCRRHLRDGGWLALFPEGTSHSDPSLKALKTGAARICLSALDHWPADLPLRIVPVGLTYEAKETFRSQVALQVGPPLDVRAFALANGTDFAAAQALTADLTAALATVTLQADSEALWRGMLAVAAWTRSGPMDDLADRQARARTLAAAYKALLARNPARAEALVQATQAFVQHLQALGVADPLALEPVPPTQEPVSPTLAPLLKWTPLVLLVPLALLGAVLGWLPYLLVRPGAVALARGETDLIGTFKLLLGLVVLTLTYATEALAAGLWLGPLAGLAVLAVAPLSGYVALRWGERWVLRRQALRAAWLRGTRAEVAAEVVARRREWVAAIEAELAVVAT